MLQFTQYTKIKFVTINSQYCDFLRTFDDRVPYNADAKKFRPFIGILFRVHDMEYFAPLSSPKEKHKRMKNTIDFRLLYEQYKKDKLPFHVKTRCCNYLVLEEKCLEYNKEIVEI